MTAARLQPVFRGLRLPVLIVLAIALAIALAGCASRPPQLVEVRVAVPVECRVAKPARPAMPTDGLSLAADLERKVRAILAELEIRQGYELELEAALDACTRPPPP